MVLTKKDCIKCETPLFLDEGVIVLNESAMKGEYRSDKYQLVTCCGFAANPTTIAAARGSGVFMSWLIDDDQSRYGRSYFIGIAKPKAVARWLKAYRDQIKSWAGKEATQKTIEFLEEYSKKSEQELLDKQKELWEHATKQKEDL